MKMMVGDKLFKHSMFSLAWSQSLSTSLIQLKCAPKRSADAAGAGLFEIWDFGLKRNSVICFTFHSHNKN